MQSVFILQQTLPKSLISSSVIEQAISAQQRLQEMSRPHITVIEQLGLTQNRLQEMPRALINSSVIEQIISIQNRLKDVLQVGEGLDIEPDGILDLGSIGVLSDEINQAISEFFSIIYELDFSNKFWELWQGLTRPLQTVVLGITTYIILPYLISISAGLTLPHIQYYMNQFIFKSNREVKQAIKKCPYDLDTCNFSGFRIKIKYY